MRLPSMCVTVPVAATLKSPFKRTAPTASPGLNGAVSLRAALEVDVPPLGTAMNPRPPRIPEERGIVSGAELDIDRGTAIGLVVVLLLAAVAPNAPASLSNIL